MKKILKITFVALYTNTAICQTLQFTYDGAGNRIKQVKTGTMPVPSLTASLNTIQAGQNSTLNLRNCSSVVTSSNNRNGLTQKALRKTVIIVQNVIKMDVYRKVIKLK